MSAVTHVVLVEWDGEDRSSEASALARDHLTRIDGVDSVQAGPSVSTEGKEGGFHWMLVVRFLDHAALDAYLPHPEHRRSRSSSVGPVRGSWSSTCRTRAAPRPCRDRSTVS